MTSRGVGCRGSPIDRLIGSSVDVVIETQFDHDWYAVTLYAGTTYTIQARAIGGR